MNTKTSKAAAAAAAAHARFGYYANGMKPFVFCPKCHERVLGTLASKRHSASKATREALAAHLATVHHI